MLENENFDWKIYLYLNPDLAQILGYNKERAIEHWNNYGKIEKRGYKGKFNWINYINNNPDLNYIKTYDEALEHIITKGFKENRVEVKINNMKIKREKEMIGKKSIAILINIHKSNINLIPEFYPILDLISNINWNSINIDIFLTISYDNKDEIKMFDDIIKELKGKYQINIEVIENKGYDIGAFFYSINNILNYDYVLRLHSKSDKVILRYILSSLGGSEYRILRAIEIFTNYENIMFIGPDRYIMSIKNTTFNKNRYYLDKLCKKFNIDNDYKNSVFIAYTCFWVRGSFLKILNERVNFRQLFSNMKILGDLDWHWYLLQYNHICKFSSPLDEKNSALKDKVLNHWKTADKSIFAPNYYVASKLKLNNILRDGMKGNAYERFFGHAVNALGYEIGVLPIGSFIDQYDIIPLIISNEIKINNDKLGICYTFNKDDNINKINLNMIKDLHKPFCLYWNMNIKETNSKYLKYILKYEFINMIDFFKSSYYIKLNNAHLIILNIDNIVVIKTLINCWNELAIKNNISELFYINMCNIDLSNNNYINYYNSNEKYYHTLNNKELNENNIINKIIDIINKPLIPLNLLIIKNNVNQHLITSTLNCFN